MVGLDLAGVPTHHHVAWAKRAVLLVDIVESVRHMEQDETGTISRWLDFGKPVAQSTVTLQFSGIISPLVARSEPLSKVNRRASP